MKAKQASASGASRDVWFSHFQTRQTHQLSSEPLYSTKFSRDGSMIASSFQDGEIQILSSKFGDSLYKFYSDVDSRNGGMTCFPVTGLGWRPT